MSTMTITVFGDQRRLSNAKYLAEKKTVPESIRSLVSRLIEKVRHNDSEDITIHRNVLSLNDQRWLARNWVNVRTCVDLVEHS
jgi:hypothetical protein